ncbi:MAG: ATP phosphoribosyltransferase regulatory subunit [Rickettsiales bacterium]|nr:ATP phosphoribosyltransferase regulatory subunit [Rickettsiales bacterium]
MSDSSSKALLPDGLRDTLPPDAAHEAAIIDRLMQIVGARGYERVEPPLVEFEDSLLDGAGQDVALATFRLMDPVSQRMMGVRADITPQVARIAATRLIKAARPLRLAYAGPVLRVRGDQLRPERQFNEVGVELFGPQQAAADIEIVSLAADALMGVGVKDLSIDLNVPMLTPMVCNSVGMDDAKMERARLALDRKDAAGVAELGGEAARILGGLLNAAGPMESALYALSDLDLPDAASDTYERLRLVSRRISEAVPNLTLTIDPVENRGFEYYTGLSFTFFARGVRGSLGRGGRYITGIGAEPAIGFTLFLDSIVRAVGRPKEVQKVFIPFGTTAKTGADLRGAGWITLSGLSPEEETEDAARQQECTHVLADGKPVALSGD